MFPEYFKQLTTLTRIQMCSFVWHRDLSKNKYGSCWNVPFSYGWRKREHTFSGLRLHKNEVLCLVFHSYIKGYQITHPHSVHSHTHTHRHTFTHTHITTPSSVMQNWFCFFSHKCPHHNERDSFCSDQWEFVCRNALAQHNTKNVLLPMNIRDFQDFCFPGLLPNLIWARLCIPRGNDQKQIFLQRRREVFVSHRVKNELITVWWCGSPGRETNRTADTLILLSSSSSSDQTRIHAGPGNLGEEEMAAPS